MRVLVCVKHVPELVSDRGFTEAGHTRRTVDDSSLNEVDENAVEAALQLADGGEVIALTMGPAIASDALRRALAMGADRAIHLLDDAFAGSDAIATARVLGAAIAKVNDSSTLDVVVAGLAALDGLGAVVPSLVAAELGWPQLTVVEEIHACGEGVQARRELDGVTEVWRSPTPVVVSVTDLANQARLPKMKDLLAARSAEIIVWSPADLGLNSQEVGRAGSGTTVLTAQRRPPHPGPVLVTDDDGAGGAALASYLIENDLMGARK
ncbi:MAG: electron transfer flavoprotein subunit beta/FixA family protein [Beutenbergiaceae bacterium]